MSEKTFISNWDNFRKSRKYFGKKKKLLNNMLWVLTRIVLECRKQLKYLSFSPVKINPFPHTNSLQQTTFKTSRQNYSNIFIITMKLLKQGIYNVAN